MEKEFIPYEQALELKELGFNEPCFIYWVFNNVEITFSTDNNKSGWSMIGFKNSQMNKKLGLCTAPTYQQAFRWFREKYGLYSYIEPVNVVGAASPIKHDYVILENNEEEVFYTNMPYHSHEEAELACLKKLIKIVKQ